MKFYPFVLIPSQLENALTCMPEVPEEPLPPPKLAIPPQPQKYEGLGTILTVFILINLLILLTVFPLFPFSLSLSLVGIFYFRRHLSRSYPNKFNVYQARCFEIQEEYQNQVEVYADSHTRWSIEKNEILSPDNIQDYRFNRILSELKYSARPDFSNSEAPKGYSEDLFFDCLTNWFGDKICRGYSLQIPGFNYPYTPDVCFVDTEKNLWIDIEIDEPYGFKSRQPIHYLYLAKDEERNHFFLKKGWVIIRFAEEQVVKYPNECCKFVAQQIPHILLDEEILVDFQGIPEVPQVQRWTCDQAEMMCENQYRNSYLNSRTDRESYSKRNHNFGTRESIKRDLFLDEDVDEVSF